MKKNSISLVSICLAIFILLLSSCNNTNSSLEENTITNNNDITINTNSQGIGREDYIPLNIDQMLNAAMHFNMPIAITEIEILDTIPRETYAKYESTMFGDINFTDFYNAKVNNIYYSDKEIEIPDNIVFTRSTNNSFTSGYRFVCFLISVESSHGEQYRGVYGALAGEDSIFEINIIDDEEFLLKNGEFVENIFNLDLPENKKEEIHAEIERENEFSRTNDNTQRERFISYHDTFINKLVDYAISYREAQGYIVESSIYNPINIENSAEGKNEDIVNSIDVNNPILQENESDNVIVEESEKNNNYLEENEIEQNGLSDVFSEEGNSNNVTENELNNIVPEKNEIKEDE